MLPHLRLRKIRRLTSNRKGFSSIVGAVFAVLIMVSLIATVFVWTLSQNTLYNNSVRQSNLADLDRSNERIATDCSVNRVDDTMVAVSGTIENYGPLSVEIATVWVKDATNQNYNYASLDMALPSGSTATFSGSTEINVPLANSAGDSLSCWFITARGNTVSEKTFFTTVVNNTNIYGNDTAYGNATWALISQGIGAFAFDFTSFRYYNVTANSTGNYINRSAGLASYVIPYGGNVAFSFNLTNMYPSQESITIYFNSEMWSYFPASPGQATGPVWYPVNVNSAGVISTSYIPVILNFNETTQVFFAHQSSNPTWVNQQKNQLGAVNLLMFGKFLPSSLQYAQNIPFVAIFAAT